MMISMIFFALLNGFCIGLSRSLNGQLSQFKGPFKASYYNHLIGFLLLSLILIGLGFEVKNLIKIGHLDNWHLFLGGLIGALYVALNSYVLSLMDTTRAALFVISGQMLAGILLDILLQTEADKLLNYGLQALGIILIIWGIRISLDKSKPAKQRPTSNIPVNKLTKSEV